MNKQEQYELTGREIYKIIEETRGDIPLTRYIKLIQAQDRKSRKEMLEWGTGNCTNPEHFGFKSHWHRFKCLECMAELEEELK